MRLLVDTRILIWLFAGGEDARKLRPHHREIVLDPAHDVLVSVVSLWEIAMKVRTGRLQVLMADVTEGMAEVDFSLLPVLDTHLAALAALPLFPDHRDPFDHLLIAQAIAEDLTFFSLDGHMARYPVRMLA